jgi:predicted flap endonuclease-1-like 5' DNA nuclease
MGRLKTLALDAQIRRFGLAAYYLDVLGAPPESENKWYGRGGHIATTLRLWKISAGSKKNVRDIFRAASICHSEGRLYDGAINYTGTVGRPSLLSTSSVECQIVADAIEDGFSTAKATELLNDHLNDEAKPAVTLAAVAGLRKRLKGRTRRVKKQKQGSKKPDSPWAKARYGFNLQMLIRYGLRKSQRKDDGTLPNYWNEEILRSEENKLNINGTVSWDETHVDCTIGNIGGTLNDMHTTFPRDASGRIDVSEGQHDKDPPGQLNVKYEKQVRLCLGCAATMDSSGKVTGRVAKSFDYSGRIVLTIKDWNARMYTEFKRVKGLTSKSSQWVENTRKEGDLWRNDDVTLVKGIGPAAKQKLGDHGITTVGELKSLSDELIKTIAEARDKAHRVGKDTLEKYRESVQGCFDEDAPVLIKDHRKAENPYASLFGEEFWEAKLKQASHMSAYVCITEMVTHIHDESARVMKGTVHENDWKFYHDALSLMTAKDTIAWMKKMDYYKRWILPIEGLFHDDPALKVYIGRPVGDSPENMPWDTSLNQDVHIAVRLHVNYTSLLLENSEVVDPKKFSLSTPIRGSSAYLRILEAGISPRPERIVQDINRVLESMKQIVEAGGIAIDGIGNRSGRRADDQRASNGPKPRGGKRKRGPNNHNSNVHIHPDAVEARLAKIKRSKGIYYGSNGDGSDGDGGDGSDGGNDGDVDGVDDDDDDDDDDEQDEDDNSNQP